MKLFGSGSSSPASFGGWLALKSPVSAETLGKAGLDFVCIDTQHGEADIESILPLLHAAGGRGKPVLARIGWPDERLLMRTLDFGVDGVIVPMIESAAQATAMARASRYAPVGERSYGPLRTIDATTGAANDRVAFFPMIETPAALEAAYDIAAVEGVDGLFVGPFDLGLLLGVSAKDVPTSELVFDAYKKIVEAGDRAGVAVGTIAVNEEHAQRQLDIGVRFISLGSDNTFVQQGARARVELAERLRTRTPATVGTEAPAWTGSEY